VTVEWVVCALSPVVHGVEKICKIHFEIYSLSLASYHIHHYRLYGELCCAIIIISGEINVTKYNINKLLGHELQCIVCTPISSQSVLSHRLTSGVQTKVMATAVCPSSKAV
jgi:hypothetical protein